MKTKTKYLIPAFAAVFALTFAFVTPYVMADGGYDGHFKMGPRHHGGHQAVTVDGFTGSITIPEEIDRESMKELKDLVSVSLVDAVNAIPEDDETNYMTANIGVVKNESGEKFVAWILAGMTMEESTVTKNIFVVDAGNADNTKSVSQTFDLSSIEEMKSQWEDRKTNFSGDFEGMKEQFKVPLGEQDNI